MMTVKKIAGISVSTLAALLMATSAFAHDGKNVATGHKGGKVVDSWGNCIVSVSGNNLCEKEEPVKPTQHCKNVQKCTPVNVTMNRSLSGDTNFGFDKANLTAAGEAELAKLIASMRGVSVRSIQVTGHTDAVGSESYNQALSERRAATVADYMVANGVNGALISASGMGESQATLPASASNAERAVDRRVDVVVSGTSRGAAKQNCTTQMVCEEIAK